MTAAPKTMTSIIDPQTDKVLNTYHQYERLTTDKDIAAQLTMAHFIDRITCILIETTEFPPEVVKVGSDLK